MALASPLEDRLLALVRTSSGDAVSAKSSIAISALGARELGVPGNGYGGVFTVTESASDGNFVMIGLVFGAAFDVFVLAVDCSPVVAAFEVLGMADDAPFDVPDSATDVFFGLFGASSDEVFAVSLDELLGLPGSEFGGVFTGPAASFVEPLARFIFLMSTTFT